MSLKKQARYWLVAFIFSVPMLAACFWLNLTVILNWFSGLGASLPDDAQIVSLTVVGWKEKPSFAVPADLYAEILAPLRRGTKDCDPGNWFHLGSLKLLCKDGREVRVDWYSLDERTFAFSITGPHGSAYYRGGAREPFRQAIQKAYERTSARKSPGNKSEKGR